MINKNKIKINELRLKLNNIKLAISLLYDLHKNINKQIIVLELLEKIKGDSTYETNKK